MHHRNAHPTGFPAPLLRLLLAAMFCFPALERAAAKGPAPGETAGSASKAADTQELESAIRNVPDQPPNAGPRASAQNDGSRSQRLVPDLDLAELIVSSRWLLIPLGGILVLAVAVSLERLLGLRRGKTLPRKLLVELDRLPRPSGKLDPSAALQACKRYPSAASTILEALFVKIDRPYFEIERALAEASASERVRLYAKVRWLNLVVAATPVLGLLGAAWGVLDAALQTANLSPPADRVVWLVGGCVMGLITTACALALAIPAAAMSHYFERRIRGILREIDDLLVRAPRSKPSNSKASRITGEVCEKS